MPHTFTIDSLADKNSALVSIELPAGVAAALQKEAKRHRQPIAELVMQWLEDQADIREATKRIKDLHSGKTKAIPAEEVYARLGI